MSRLAGPQLPFPAQACLPDLVEAQVTRTPDAIAVICAGAELTYAELHARAARLGRRLQGLGAGADVPVAVLLDRSPALAVALLAVQLAGAACLPLDLSYPAERLRLILDDAAPPVLLTRAELAGRVPAYAGHVVVVDADGEAAPRGAADPTAPARTTRPEDLAYVIYTSGSSGVPKGVMLTHRGLVNHSTAVGRMYELGPSDRVAQFCALGFDVSIEEVFPTWSHGATLVLRPDDVPVLGGDWLAWLRRMQITVLNLPTAYWHEWVRDLHALGEHVPECVRLVIVGGEKALGSAYRTWLHVGGQRVRWLNAYGPAEASVAATICEPPAQAGAAVDRDPPIGRPIANTTIAILDEHGATVAAGQIGDLHIGGAGLARGYLHDPRLTAERFVEDPERPGERLYRTGDLVRMLDDGNLEFAGRSDEQVKIRGFRVELHELEGVLGAHPQVAEATVIAREDTPGTRRLVAYVVAEPGAAPAPSDLRRFMSERLPSNMVPSSFMRLATLPLTPNGKVDRDALPAPGDPRSQLGADRIGPRSPTEQTIAEIWSRTLDVDAIGVDDDFFELGGHSLLAAQVIAAVRRALAVDIGVRALLDAPTVARLAALVEPLRGEREQPPPLVVQRRDRGAPIPLTLSQRQMWQLETTADPPGLFNVTAMRRFAERVDEHALRAALEHLAARHETLRTSFHVGGDGPYQAVAPSPDVDLSCSDLSSLPAESEGDRELRRLLAAQDSAPFELALAPLWRACLYRLADDRSLVAVTFDHLICDGTSAYVFLSDLAAAYEALAAGAEPSLRPLALQYPDFALWQQRWLTPQRLAVQLEYWKRKLAGMPTGPALPLDRIPDRPTRRIVKRPVSLTGELYDGLRELARATRSTVFIVVTAALQSLLSRAGATTDVVLSTTLSGRGHAQLEGLVGCFHGVGRIRTDLSGDPSFELVVERTRETVLGLFEHQDLPFMRIRQAVLPDMPRGGPALLAAVPIELQYFHTTHDEWAPGAGVVERPGADRGPNELFFRGHLHPLNVTFLDDGAQLWGEFSYKPDFYDDTTIERLAIGLEHLVAAVTRAPGLRLSELPTETRSSGTAR